MLTDDARDLSLTIAAREDGFEVAPDAPLWLFLPAIWPVESRAWTATTGSDSSAP